MKKSLLATVAVVALLTSPALAAEQKEAPAPAPAAQQKAPAEKIAPAGAVAPKAEMKAAPKETTGQASPKAEGTMKANDAPKAAETKKENEPAKMNSSQAEPKAAPKAAETTKGNAAPKASEAAKSNDTKAAEGAKSNATKTQTTGQGASGASGASVSLTTEQKTKIRTTVLKSAPRVTNVNFSISVGTAIPRSTHVVVVPETLVEIHPAWRGFMYFVVNDEIIIVDPHSYEIIAVLDV